MTATICRQTKGISTVLGQAGMHMQLCTESRELLQNMVVLLAQNGDEAAGIWCHLQDVNRWRLM